MNGRRPTIKDVARDANVSIATVSRTLRWPDLVSESTRDRVMEAVHRVGYTPNVVASNLRRRQTGSVFLVVRNMRNPFYLEVFDGVEAEASALGYNVLMGNTQDDEERERSYFEMVKANVADGLILMTGRVPQDIQASELPPMVIGLEYYIGADLPTVRIDNAAAAKMAVEHLIDLGHRRIAHITGPQSDQIALDRRLGYEEALAACGINARQDYIVPGDYSLQAGANGLSALLRCEPAPTAVFCSNDEMAMGVVNQARRCGLDTPADLSVVGFDDISFARAFYPPLTTIRQPRHEIGRMCMALLNKVLRGAPLGPQPLLMETELVVRDSTAPPRTDD